MLLGKILTRLPTESLTASLKYWPKDLETVLDLSQTGLLYISKQFTDIKILHTIGNFNHTEIILDLHDMEEKYDLVLKKEHGNYVPQDLN